MIRFWGSTSPRDFRVTWPCQMLPLLICVLTSLLRRCSEPKETTKVLHLKDDAGTGIEPSVLPAVPTAF